MNDGGFWQTDELSLLTASAVGSLDEGFDESLTLHRLGLFKELGLFHTLRHCRRLTESQHR